MVRRLDGRHCGWTAVRTVRAHAARDSTWGRRVDEVRVIAVCVVRMLMEQQCCANLSTSHGVSFHHFRNI